jgi:hypothetical protein
MLGTVPLDPKGIASGSITQLKGEPEAPSSNHRSTMTIFSRPISRRVLCQNFEQYYGKVVNGLDGSILYGSNRFPDHPTITALDEAAKIRASSGAFAQDAILFGKWRD